MKRIPLQFLLFKERSKKAWLVLMCFLFLTNLQAQNLVANYRLDTLSANRFQVSIIPDTTFNTAGSLVSSMQVVVRVPTGGFALGNLTDLISAGQPNQAVFFVSSQDIAPVQNPQFDYFSIGLTSGVTPTIPFTAGVPVPLFTFQNVGNCTQDSLSLIQPDDPFHFNNNGGSVNVQQQLSITGLGQPDAPVGALANRVSDCIDNCVVEFEIEKLTNGAFQASLIPRVTYTGNNRRIGNLQFSVKIRSAGFEAGNIINLLNTGLINEVRFDQTSRVNSPSENPGYDYLGFSLLNTSTVDIVFEENRKVPLFTFNNVGFCTDDTLRLITVDDPFHSTNSTNSNFNQQISILGFGTSDAPVCINNTVAEDCTRDCYLGCNDNVQVSLGINCEAEVLPEMVATALTLTCPNGPKGVEILENGVVIPTSPFVNESHIGRTFQVRVIDSITTNSCWGSIIVKDKTAPVIFCENDTVNCALQDISPDNPLLGYPTVIDYCSDTVSNLNFTDRFILNGCGTGFSGRLERTWSATDSAGMTGTCVQNIYFIRQPLDSVVFPVNRDGLEGPVVDCTDGATDPSNTGSPTINGDAIYPNIIGVCQIDAGFRDDSVSFCEGNLQIIRTWTVVDGCTGDYRTDIQIISVQDTTPPVLIGPDTIRGTVDDFTCSGTITFPAATVSDACSGARVSISTPFGNINSNGGSLNWIPRGRHTVTYIAIDSCNNQATFTAVLMVEDRTPPVAACDFINDVSLRPNGTVEVQASLFDDGSRDGCSGDQLTFLAQRVGDTLDFAPTVTFFCMDAGDTVNVNLRVTDLDGNIDECVAAIVISNDSPPQITCPANQTIQCTDDYSDLSVFGIPTIIDDCGGNTAYTERDSFAIDSCGTGRIFRIFSINHGGNIVSCQQTITIENNSVFDGNSIVWPADYITLACENMPLHPDSLPDGFNVPTYDSTGNLCSRILRRYSDAPFDDVADPIGCYKILRTWELIDWCVFDANDTLAGGYWSYVQQIDITNGIAPIFTNCPTDFTVNVTDNSCAANLTLAVNATDDCTPDNLLTYTYAVDLGNDGINELTGDTNDISGVYPVGVHRILFTVSDDCGNVNTCNFIVTIEDNTLPKVTLNTDTFNVEDINGERLAIINPRLLAIASTDDCTIFDDLVITARPASFDCSQEGLNQVTVSVTDEAGNADSATVNVFITDNNNICPINRTAVSIRGRITNEMGERMEQVSVTINHPDVQPAMTDAYGEFNLKEVPVGNDYTLLPARDFDILNGVSAFDIVLISRHILNIEPLKSPYRMIAADVNRSGTITAFDLVQLRRLILRVSTEFPNNSAWRFVRSDFVFEEDPNQTYFPEVYNINDLPKEDMEIEGFVAIKVGDVNASANTNAFGGESVSRNLTNQLTLVLEDQLVPADEEVVVPVLANQFGQLLGYQFALNFDAEQLELTDLIPNEKIGVKAGNFGLKFIEKGILTTTWEQAELMANQAEKQVLFTLKFKAKRTINLSESIAIHPDFVNAEAYELTNGKMDLLGVKLQFENASKKEVTLLPNRPNPFNQSTIIGFELPKAAYVNLRILDLTGKVIQQSKIEGKAGYNEVTISSKSLEGKGIYYYQLATSEGIKTKKMLLIE